MAKNYQEFRIGYELIEGDDGYLPYEKKAENQCNAIHDNSYCTRTKNHEGAHAAHGSSGELYATWEDN